MGINKNESAPGAPGVKSIIESIVIDVATISSNQFQRTAFHIALQCGVETSSGFPRLF